jgi:hypothetical protein
MGLDVYVGSFTRCYAGDSELVTQTAARELGLALQVSRLNDPADAIRNPEHLRPMVTTWQKSLSEDLADHLKEPLSWDEAPGSPYFTDKPTWDCYGDLTLWAAYQEQPHLSHDVALWLSCDFQFVFRTDDIGGEQVACRVRHHLA